MPTCPSIDWPCYFRDLDRRRQSELEHAGRISLGEYMAIIEHAAIDTSAKAISVRGREVRRGNTSTGVSIAVALRQAQGRDDNPHQFKCSVRSAFDSCR